MVVWRKYAFQFSIMPAQGIWLWTGWSGFDPRCRRGGDFSLLLCVQTGPGMHSASCRNEYQGFPGGKDGQA